MKNIAIIGAGTMGNGIAHAFAQSGFHVTLVDRNMEALENGKANIEKNLSRQVTKGIIDEAGKQAALDRLFLATITEVEYDITDLVVEAIYENFEAKAEIFRSLDEKCPSATILASNTSSISITKLAAATSRPDRVIGMHFMNPVPVMKLVEVIKGYATSQATLNAVLEATKALGKVPVPANDYPGFVANRILMPMINEAICALQEGVAGIAEIDEIMKLGMAHPMGPLLLADFIGLDICLSILNVLYDGYKQPKYAPNPLLVNLVTAGDKGAKTGKGFYIWAEGKAQGPSF